MQFNVSQLMREPIGSRRQYLVQETFAPYDDQTLLVHVEGPVELLRTHRGLLATASLSSDAEGECARCLTSLSFPVRLEIQEEFLPTVDPITGGRIPPPEEPGVFTIDERHTLDLTEAARQAWLLAVPMRVLCREDCAGLCPTCGADRNAGPCGCAAPPLDSRWAKLAALPRHDLNRLPEEN